MRNLPFIFLLMTTLSLTSELTYAQSKQSIRTDSQLESRKQRIKAILPSSSFDYLFPLRHESFNYSSLVDTLASKQQFCHRRQTTKQTDKACRQDLAEFFTMLSFHTANRDPYLGIEIWRQGLYFPVVNVSMLVEQISQVESQILLPEDRLNEYLMFAAFLDVPEESLNIALNWQQTTHVHAKVFSPYK